MSKEVQAMLRPSRYPRSAKYDPRWLLDLEMGPNPLWQLEDLLDVVSLRPGQKVLDLGCGKGATSVFLANEFDVEVVALDLWVAEEELRGNLEAAGVASRVTAVNGDIRQHQFEPDFFDAIISVDAFEYFGTDARFLPGLVRALRPGGLVGMTTPALRIDPYEVPPPAHIARLIGWEAAAWHAPSWWATHWRLSDCVVQIRARMQNGGREDWLIWSRALGEQDASVTQMLEADADDLLGFAIVSATKPPS